MAVNPSFDERASPYGLRANAFPADTAIVGNCHACFEKRLSLAWGAWRQVAKQNYRRGNPLRAGAGLGRACAGVLSPRVRGNQIRKHPCTGFDRSIPACAGGASGSPARRTRRNCLGVAGIFTAHIGATQGRCRQVTEAKPEWKNRLGSGWLRPNAQDRSPACRHPHYRKMPAHLISRLAGVSSRLVRQAGQCGGWLQRAAKRRSRLRIGMMRRR